LPKKGGLHRPSRKKEAEALLEGEGHPPLLRNTSLAKKERDRYKKGCKPKGCFFPEKGKGDQRKKRNIDICMGKDRRKKQRKNRLGGEKSQHEGREGRVSSALVSDGKAVIPKKKGPWRRRFSWASAHKARQKEVRE